MRTLTLDGKNFHPGPKNQQNPGSDAWCKSWMRALPFREGESKVNGRKRLKKRTRVKLRYRENPPGIKHATLAREGGMGHRDIAALRGKN